MFKRISILSFSPQKKVKQNNFQIYQVQFLAIPVNLQCRSYRAVRQHKKEAKK